MRPEQLDFKDRKKTAALPVRVYNAVCGTVVQYAPPTPLRTDEAQVATESPISYMRVDRLIMSIHTFRLLEFALGPTLSSIGQDPRVQPVTVFDASVVIDDRLPLYAFEVAMAVSYDA